MVVRNIDEELDSVILRFKNQLEGHIEKEITYKLATKLYANIVQKHIYIKSVYNQKAKRKKDRKIIFKIEMKNE